MKKIILCILLFSVSLLSVDAEKVLSEKEKEKFLKKIKWSKVKSSFLKKYEFVNSKPVEYSGCGEDFPKLPGDFPCTFLSDEISQGTSEETYQMDASSGKIDVKISKNDSEMGGKVFYVSDEDGADQKEFLLRVFYKKDRFISYYIYKNQLTYFEWEGKGNDKTLVAVYILNLTDKQEPENIRRISF
jgi:hypothetical protein